VIDVLGEGMRAVAMRSPLAYPLVFAAGVVTSIGPCAASRYVAVAALVSASRTPVRVVGAFVAGLVGAYVVLGAVAGVLGALGGVSGTIYAGLAVVLGAGGLITLLRGADPHHGDAHCRRARASLGGALLLGASSAFVVSPCCTPLVAGIAGLTTLSGHADAGAALLASFALGHAMPVVAAGALGSQIRFVLRRVAASHAPPVVAGTLMIALAVYYGVLA
jgi:cytochrome c-type biogenesis protein